MGYDNRGPSAPYGGRLSSEHFEGSYDAVQQPSQYGGSEGAYPPAAAYPPHPQ